MMDNPLSFPVGSAAFSLGVKQPGNEVNHSPESSAECKNVIHLLLFFKYDEASFFPLW